LNTTAYITVNVFLFFSWYLLLFRHKRYISFVDRIAGTFVLSLSQIIATEMMLGVVMQQLYAGPLLVINLIISLLVIIVPSAVSRELHLSIELIKKVFDEIRNEFHQFLRLLKGDKILISIFVLLTASIFWIILQGYLLPSYTWDALWYHLPIVGNIMQSGAIREIPVNSFIEQFINIFPKNIELFFLWNIIFLKSDVIVDLSQLLFTVAGVFTVYSLALKLNINEKYAVYSGLLFFFTPIIILQSTTNYVDVAIAVLFLLAINFLIIAGDGTDNDLYLRIRKLSVVIAGLTTGVLFGAKGSGPLFVSILTAAILVQEVVRNKRTQSSTRAMITALSYSALYFLVPVLLLGGYWYIKNWVVYGNPVYPMAISLFGITLFKGLYKGIIEPAPEIINSLSYVTRPLYVWLENTKYYLYDSRLGGLGPVWFILLLPSLLFSLAHVYAKKNYNYFIIFIIIAAAFALYPRNWTPRYVIFLPGLGALSFGLMLERFSRRDTWLKFIALILIFYTCIVANSPSVTPKKVSGFMSLSASERTIGWQAPFNIDLHARQEYGHWIWISRNVNEGDTLAYTFVPLFHSPLWNSSFTSRIAYVKAGTYQEWKAGLKENNAAFVLIRNKSQEDKWTERERQLRHSFGWLGQVEEKFNVVYSDDNYKVLEVSPNNADIEK
jgi:hypothetical protein